MVMAIICRVLGRHLRNLRVSARSSIVVEDSQEIVVLERHTATQGGREVIRMRSTSDRARVERFELEAVGVVWWR